MSVLAFASKERADQAWTDYVDLRAQTMADPGLLTDRPFMERLILAEDRWRRLSKASER